MSIVTGLREYRERRHISQDALAMRARDFGLTAWTRSTVAKIEGGERDLNAEEFVMLSLLLDAPLTDLVAGADTQWVVLGPELKLRRRALRHLLGGGNPRDIDPDDLPEMGLWRRQIAKWAALDPAEDKAAIKALAEQLHGRGPTAYGEAEEKAGRNLGMPALDVVRLAHRLWKRSLTDERERQLAELLGKRKVTDRSRQALRGRVTHRLMKELRAQAEREVAARVGRELRIKPGQVIDWSRRLWGRSIAEERYLLLMAGSGDANVRAAEIEQRLKDELRVYANDQRRPGGGKK